jgi:hypothetical protein
VDIRVECVTPDDLSGKKRVWFRGIFHLIGILGESLFVSKLRKAESAQHSVPDDHRDNAVDAGDCRFAQAFRVRVASGLCCPQA